MAGKKHAAIVLAAGKGTRVGGEYPKQFQKIVGKPAICYSLQVFEESFIDEIVLVVPDGMQEECREKIVEHYGFSKVTQVISGGEARYDSVYRGLCAIRDCDYVYIHDGARPFLDTSILMRANQCVTANDACAAGIPMRDTIKVVDDAGFVVETPERSNFWLIQTPQAFSYALVREAYDKLYESDTDRSDITDDAMVVERMLSHPVKLFEGSYRNMKITMPEDMILAERILNG